MRYQSKSSVSYMFRNFAKLFFVTLPMALLLAFAFYLCKPFGEIQILSQAVNGKLTMDNYLGEFFSALTVLRFGKYWWVQFIALAVLPLCAGIMVVKVDRHMRTGVMPALPLKRSFGIYPLMLMYTLCAIAANELGTLIAVGIAAMIRFVGSVTAITVVTVVLVTLVKAMWVYVFTLLVLSFPLKYSENYRFNRALSYSARIMFRKKRTLWGWTVTMPLARLAVLALAFLADYYNVYYAAAVFYALVMFFAVTYVPCFAYKQYYDEVGGERRDISKIIFG